jgi:DNA-directed RNA polymerase specialized sigma24 family protein
VTPDSDPAVILAAARHSAHSAAHAMGIARLLGDDGIESAANLAAANSIRRWRADRGRKFNGFLAVMVRYQLIDDVRSRYGRHHRHPVPVPLDGHPEPASAADWASSDVESFLASLSPSTRWVIECLIAGVAAVEIAAHLGVTESAVSHRLRDVRRSWDDYCRDHRARRAAA